MGFAVAGTALVSLDWKNGNFDNLMSFGDQLARVFCLGRGQTSSCLDDILIGSG